MTNTDAITFDSGHQLYHFNTLKDFQTVAHAVSTRNSFFVSDFNLSFHTGNEEQVVQNRTTLRQFFKAKTLTIPKQCHGNAVVQITGSNSEQIPADTDALITNVPGLAIGVLSADCVPILLFDPVKHALGAAHAGWKGTVANIGAATVQSMQRAYDSSPEDIIAFIGPSISPFHFEVGEEVAERFRALELTVCIQETTTEKPHVDLWKANKLLLQQTGVKEFNIHTAAICTVDHTEHFYSARGEGFGTGRFGAFIMLR